MPPAFLCSTPPRPKVFATLDPAASEGIRHGTIWATNAHWVAFCYSPTGDAESVKRFLGPDLARTV